MPIAKAHLRVERTAAPPLPWIWLIHRDGEAVPARRALRSYRSAEEAWDAGRAVLARLGRAEGPER